MSQSIIDYLVADHHRLHALLTQASAQGTLDAAAFAQFRGGLLRHIAIEEKILFPTVRAARGGLPLELAHALRVEHAALTSLLVPPPTVELCGEIGGLLSVHDAKEEGPHGVYAQCAKHLSPELLVEMGQRAAAFPQVRVAPHLDRPDVYRTASAALSAASRIQPAPARRP